MRKLLFLVAIFLFTFITACHKDSLLNTSNLSLPEEVVETGKRYCGTDEYHEHLMKTDETYRLAHAQMEEQIARFVANYDKQIQSRSVITIPVVFHVLYNNRSVDSISIAAIDNLLASVNKDFRRMNRDTASTPAEFKSVAADLEIQFVRAKRTPNGLSSSGVEYRKLNNKTFLGETKLIKSYTQGGLNAWNATQYLNIWTCQFQGGVLGIGTFPETLASSPALDGVVIDYRTIPGVSNLLPEYNKGRALTHEVGHWLGLLHTFNDGCEGGGDLVSDTPPERYSVMGCPIATKSCPNSSSNDMITNYMDYTNDACKNIFTKGQKARVWSIFAQGGARVGLLTSPGGAEIPPNSTKCYQLVNSNSGLVLDISSSVANRVIQNTVSTNKSQKWGFLPLTNDYHVKITNKGSNLVLRAAATSEGAPVFQDIYAAGGSCDWYVTNFEQGIGFVRIQNKLSGKYLSVRSNATYQTTAEMQTRNTANLSQVWLLREVVCP